MIFHWSINNHGKQYMTSDIHLIKHKWENNYSIGHIAKLLERKPSAIFCKIIGLGLVNLSDFGYSGTRSSIDWSKEENKVCNFTKHNLNSEICSFPKDCDQISADSLVANVITTSKLEAQTLKLKKEDLNMKKFITVRVWVDNVIIPLDVSCIFEKRYPWGGTIGELRDEVLVEEGLQIKQSLIELGPITDENETHRDLNLKDVRWEFKEV